jgi:gas vesicle protein
LTRNNPNTALSTHHYFFENYLSNTIINQQNLSVAMSKSGKTFVAFLAGVATGAALGILYAPDKGENTRNLLSYKLTKYREQLQKLIADLLDGNELPESLAKTEGKKVVSEAREKAERLLADVESLMGQIKNKN